MIPTRLTHCDGESRPRLRSPRRRGAMIVLIAVLMIVFLGMVAFAVDVSYMQMTRGELRAATDAAAKAAASELARQQDDGPALAAAIDIASKNFVGGKPLEIDATNVIFGQSQMQADGSWSFVAGAEPYRAVQVNVDMSEGTTPGPVDLFFGRIFGRRTFTPHCASVASHLDVELALVIDRSHSMCFNLTGVDWRYPSPVNTDRERGLRSPPINGSRWKALEGSITTFVNIVKAINKPPRIALITWGSEVPAGSYDANLPSLTVPAVSLDLPLGNNYDAVDSSIRTRGQSVVLGGTNMAAGMDKGREVLTAADIRPYAKKIMILMTDGLWNQGRNPIECANEARAAGIVVHTITFLPGADQSTMQQIADITGGKHYYADNQAELTAAFRDIALTLPIALTE